MKYSVVIPTFNRAGMLRIALHSVINQTVPPRDYEIIVVDDGSKDHTKNTVAEIQKKFQQHSIRYFYQENGGQAAAKNTGIKKATGEIIFFTDDDCIVPTDWIEKLARGYARHPEVAGVGGWTEPPAGEKRLFQKSAATIRFKILKKYGYFEREKLIESPFHPTCWVPNVSYKKSVLEKIGGFDEKIPSFGSDELKYRLMNIYGLKILSVPIAVIHQCPLDTWGNFKKHFRRGQARYYCRNLYKKTGPASPVFDLGFKNLPLFILRLTPNNAAWSVGEFVHVANFLFVTSALSSAGWLYDAFKNRVGIKKLAVK